MLNDLLSAIALVMVIEGLLPFVNPRAWREGLGWLGRQSDRSLRIIGLTSMLCGAVFLYLVRHF